MDINIEKMKIWLITFNELRSKGIIKDFRGGFVMFEQKIPDLNLQQWLLTIASLVNERNILNYKELLEFLDEVRFANENFMEAYAQNEAIDKEILNKLSKAFQLLLRAPHN